MPYSYAVSSPRWQRAGVTQTPSRQWPTEGVNVQSFRAMPVGIAESRGSTYLNLQYGLVNTTASQIVQDELLQGIAKNDIEPYEAQGGLSVVAIDNWEGLTGIQQTDVDNYEALVSTTTSVIVRQELLQGIAKLDQGNYEAITSLSVTIVGNWEAIVGLLSSSDGQWESSSVLIGSIDCNYESAGLITTTYIFNWESEQAFCFDSPDTETLTLQSPVVAVFTLDGVSDATMTKENATELGCDGCNE